MLMDTVHVLVRNFAVVVVCSNGHGGKRKQEIGIFGLRISDDRLKAKNRFNPGIELVCGRLSSCYMKVFLLLCAILASLIIMNTIKCPGCQKFFNHGKAIKIHQRTCAGLHIVAKEQFRKRGKNVEK